MKNRKERSFFLPLLLPQLHLPSPFQQHSLPPYISPTHPRWFFWVIKFTTNAPHLTVSNNYRNPQNKARYGAEKSVYPITEEEAQVLLPCAAHGASLPFPCLYFTAFLSLIPPLLLLLLLDNLFLMSNDDSQPRRFEPYTYISSAPNTQASNGAIGDGDGNGLFDPGNTPPLIFAFIALGFTLFGLIITVIYKRCRPLQNSPEPHHRHSTRCSVQKPKLWDVWMPADQYALAEERTKNVNDWDTFMVSYNASIVVDRLVDECPSPCQPHLYILILPLLPFVCHHNTFKVTLRGLSLGKTLNADWSSDNRRQTPPFMSLSYCRCPNHVNDKFPR